MFCFFFFFLYKSVYRSLISDELYRNFYSLKPLPAYFLADSVSCPFTFESPLSNHQFPPLPCCFIVFHHLFVSTPLQSVIVIVDLSSAFSSRGTCYGLSCLCPIPSPSSSPPFSFSNSSYRVFLSTLSISLRNRCKIFTRCDREK